MTSPLEIVVGDRPHVPACEALPFVVVVGMDFGRAAIRAVDVAVRAASRHAAAEVHVITVAPHPIAFGSFAPTAPASEHALEAGRRQLAFVLGMAHSPEHVRIFGHALLGAPAHVIVAAARRLAADVVILGTGGTSGPTYLSLRSVAKKVLERAPCSVMTLCPPRIMPSATAPGTARV